MSFAKQDSGPSKKVHITFVETRTITLEADWQGPLSEDRWVDALSYLSAEGKHRGKVVSNVMDAQRILEIEELSDVMNIDFWSFPNPECGLHVQFVAPVPCQTPFVGEHVSISFNGSAAVGAVVVGAVSRFPRVHQTSLICKIHDGEVLHMANNGLLAPYTEGRTGPPAGRVSDPNGEGGVEVELALLLPGRRDEIGCGGHK